MSLVDVSSVLLHRTASGGSHACALLALRGTPAAKLLFPPSAFEGIYRRYTQDCPERDNLGLSQWRKDGLQGQMMMMAEGTELLRRHLRAGQSVFSLTFANPFPMILHGRSPMGTLAWWDVGRTYSHHVFPPASRILADTDWIMEPIGSIPGNWFRDVNVDHMMALYGDEIRRNFAVVDESSTWRLWGRK